MRLYMGTCMWSDKNTKFYQIRAVIKYRWGVLWNARTAKRMGMTYGSWGCSQHGHSTHNAAGTNMTEAPYVTTQMEAHTPLPDAKTPA